MTAPVPEIMDIHRDLYMEVGKIISNWSVVNQRSREVVRN
jgi:hypothetical protein